MDIGARLPGILRLVLLISFLLNILLFAYYEKVKRNGKEKRRKQHIAAALPSSFSDNHRSIRMEKVSEPRLTDVIIPMPPKHFHKVTKLLKLWNEYPPCYVGGPDIFKKSKKGGENGDEGNDDHDDDDNYPNEYEEDFFKKHNYNLGHNVVLTFYVSTSTDDKLERQLLQAFDELNPLTKKCFSKARVHFANLVGDNDGYWIGTRLMFENLLENKVGLRWPHYVFYMEPDMLPLRKYWLSALDASTRNPAAPFWMRGSLFKGAPLLNARLLLALCVHINGNAIYNLADPNFRHFYFGKVYPISRNDYKTNHAYDLDVFLDLMNPNYYERVKYIAHKFQHTEIIQNYYHTPYSITEMSKIYPRAYLAHGGTPRP